MTKVVGFPVLEALDLPSAPPVLRATAAPLRRRRAPAVALLALGLLLTLGPIVGGLFSKVAAGEQLIDEFAPHLEVDALARYDTDLGVLRTGASGIDAAVTQAAVPDGQFPGIDEYRRLAPAIDERATSLLERVGAAEPDYRQVAGIGGFERVPFLIVVCGLLATYGGCVLLAGARSRTRPAAALVVLAGLAIAAYPFVSDLRDGARAGERMLDSLAPVMTHAEVRQLQDDFVVLVHAVGELDTGFRRVPQPEPAATEIATLVERWPTVSSDLASLVGAINDNIDNYAALDDLDALTRTVGVSGLGSLPWLLVGVGIGSAGLAIAAWPRRGKEAA